MSPEARRAFNAAMSAYWGSKDDGASPGEAGFKAGMLFAARLCREHAALCMNMGDGEKARTAATLADAIAAHARGET